MGPRSECVHVCAGVLDGSESSESLSPGQAKVGFGLVFGDGGVEKGVLRENRSHGSNFHVNQRLETFPWLWGGMGG